MFSKKRFQVILQFINLHSINFYKLDEITERLNPENRTEKTVEIVQMYYDEE